ncbi:MAG: succinyl-diaminopimelate desuccinylase [candidate division WS6 bacterium OLB20]|uniref:Succinyl-diaminopimelate desuccinylase n=1 Tax=candidate division WS6 bacterium OLB20 TaxID=1617426 RepID=A0A136LWZ1_9BACT|nr:MAG: succinyl-diaminopimelate desuccinylase [candidate division WS6 bacterium OLB20]
MLGKRIATRAWQNDRAELEGVINTTLASLCAFNTTMVNGPDFAGILDYYTGLMTAAGVRDMSFARVPCEFADREAMIIYPDTFKSEVDAAVGNYHAKNNETVRINHPVVHFHLDAYPLSRSASSLSTLSTHHDRKKGLVYARGANDMKGQAGLGPLLALLLQDQGYLPPVFMVTTDEEIGGSFGGDRLYRSLYSTMANIDWERPEELPDALSAASAAILM